jgi:hypothetical protein
MRSFMAAISFAPEAESNPRAVMGEFRRLLDPRSRGVISPGCACCWWAPAIYGTPTRRSAPMTLPLRPDSPYPGQKRLRTSWEASARGGEWTWWVDLSITRRADRSLRGVSFARQIAEIERAAASDDRGREPRRGSRLPGRRGRDRGLPWLLDWAPAGYNVGGGEASIRDLLDLLLAETWVRPEVKLDRARWRPANSSVGCAARLEKATGWAPRVPLRETLKRLLDGWREAVRAV